VCRAGRLSAKAAQLNAAARTSASIANYHRTHFCEDSPLFGWHPSSKHLLFDDFTIHEEPIVYINTNLNKLQAPGAPIPNPLCKESSELPHLGYNQFAEENGMEPINLVIVEQRATRKIGEHLRTFATLARSQALVSAGKLLDAHEEIYPCSTAKTPRLRLTLRRRSYLGFPAQSRGIDGSPRSNDRGWPKSRMS
jgi:hypothetical protein